jgi:hypothetical protein
MPATALAVAAPTAPARSRGRAAAGAGRPAQPAAIRRRTDARGATLTSHPCLGGPQCYKHVAALLDKQAKKNKDFATKLNVLFIAHNIIKESKKSAGAKSKFGEQCGGAGQGRAGQGRAGGAAAGAARRSCSSASGARDPGACTAGGPSRPALHTPP